MSQSIDRVPLGADGMSSALTAQSAVCPASGEAAKTALRQDLVCIIVGCLILACAWSRLALGSASLLVFPDDSEQNFPWWQYAVSEVQRGRLPLWDPYTQGGRTHVGEGQEGVFYPPFLLFARMGGAWASGPAAIHVFAFLHACLAFLGSYVLARLLRLGPLAAMASGLTFALGGCFSQRALAQLNIYYAMAWVPFVLWGPLLMIRRQHVKWNLCSGAALALSVLAGHGQPAFHASMALGMALLFLWVVPIYADRPALGFRRTAFAGVLIFVSAGALAAVQILPMAEYLPRALRWVGGDAPVVGNARIPFAILLRNPCFHVRSLPTVVFHGVGDIDDNSLYIGSAAFCLAALGALSGGNKSRLLWLGLVVLGIVFALGGATPLLKIAYYLLPFMDKVREPVRYLLLAHLGLSVLVGMGMNHMVQRLPYSWLSCLGVIGLLSAFAWAAATVWFRQPLSGPASVGLLLGVAVLSWVVALIAASHFSARHLAPVLGCGVLAAMAGELGYEWAYRMPAVAGYDGIGNREVNQYFHGSVTSQVRDFFAAHPGSYRIDLTDSPVPRNLGEVCRLRTVTGYAATIPRKFFELCCQLGWCVNDRGPALLGTRFIVTTKELPPLQPLERIGPIKIYENPKAFPLAWFVDRLELAANDKKGLMAMSAPQFDARHDAIVFATDSASLMPIGSGNPPSAAVVTYSPSRVRIDVESDHTAFLVTNEPDFPGWAARLDGERVPIYRVDYAFRGVQVPPGAHSLVFHYEPPSIIVGAWISALAAIVTLLVLVLWPATRYAIQGAAQ
jgi:hypothetical protein